MSIVSALLLLAAAGCFAAMLHAATAVDYRHLAAAAGDSSADLPGGSGGSGSGSAGLMAAARAAMAQDGSAAEQGEDEEGGEAARFRDDRPLLRSQDA